MKKFIALIAAVAAVTAVALTFTSCSKKQDDSWKTDKKYDLSVPTLNKDGWYLVFDDDFDGDGINQNIKFGENYKGNKEIWTYSPHAIRWESNDKDKPEQACYWYPDMVEVKDSKAADDFEVEYIKVYQNSNYEQYIQDDSEFKGSVDLD